MSELQREVHARNIRKGWYSDVPDARDPVWLGARIALIHSELSEALEAVRDGHLEEYVGPDGKPEGVPAELADAVIRILDVCESIGVDLQSAIERKCAHNETRKHRHGGRAL